jgi:hypothetical protein
LVTTSLRAKDRNLLAEARRLGRHDHVVAVRGEATDPPSNCETCQSIAARCDAHTRGRMPKHQHGLA